MQMGFLQMLCSNPIEHHVTFASHMITDTLELDTQLYSWFYQSFTESNKTFPAPVVSGSKVSLDVDLFGIGIFLVLLILFGSIFRYCIANNLLN